MKTSKDLVREAKRDFFIALFLGVLIILGSLMYGDKPGKGRCGYCGGVKVKTVDAPYLLSWRY